MNHEERLVALQKTLYTSRNPTRRYLHCARRDWVLAEIGGIGQAQIVSRALEVGPGSGVYLPSLADAADMVVAVDIESSHLKAANRLTSDPALKSPISLVQGDINSGVITEGSMDLVLCSEVIEHIADSSSLLTSIAKMLGSGGIVILTTPQPYSPVELLGKVAFLPGILQLLRWLYDEPIEPTGHINLLSSSALKAQFAQAGLCVVKAERMGFYLPVIAEFGGGRGQKFLAWIDRKLRHSWLEGLLWTQCYILKKVEDVKAGRGVISRDVSG